MQFKLPLVGQSHSSWAQSLYWVHWIYLSPFFYSLTRLRDTWDNSPLPPLMMSVRFEHTSSWSCLLSSTPVQYVFLGSCRGHWLGIFDLFCGALCSSSSSFLTGVSVNMAGFIFLLPLKVSVLICCWFGDFWDVAELTSVKLARQTVFEKVFFRIKAE